MVFVDTTALYASLDMSDEQHASATKTFTSLLDTNTLLLTSNYVVVETNALLQRRLGMAAVRAFTEKILPLIEIHWITKELHEAASTSLLAASRRKLSLVDCSSFAIMRASGCRTAFSYDKHFQEAGFPLPS